MKDKLQDLFPTHYRLCVDCRVSLRSFEHDRCCRCVGRMLADKAFAGLRKLEREAK